MLHSVHHVLQVATVWQCAVGIVCCWPYVANVVACVDALAEHAGQPSTEALRAAADTWIVAKASERGGTAKLADAVNLAEGPGLSGTSDFVGASDPADTPTWQIPRHMPQPRQLCQTQLT